MNILYIGSLNKGETSLARFEAIKSLGHNVVGINITNISAKVNIWSKLITLYEYILNIEFDRNDTNNKLLAQLKLAKFDIVWIDKCPMIRPQSLVKIRSHYPNSILVHYNPDDPFGRFDRKWRLLIESIPYYHIAFVSRKENIEEYKQRGAKFVHYFDRSYSSSIHKPTVLNQAEKDKYDCEVGFIGSYEENRAKTIAWLIKKGVNIKIFGNHWKNQKYWNIIKKYHQKTSLLGSDYARGICGMKIALHFLRKANRDEQDSRTFEIPACGTFMLAERSPKHEELFQEDIEAVFFNDQEDLLSKIKYYLNYPEHRQTIAVAGRERCLSSGYDHQSRMKQLLTIVDTNSI